MTIIKSTAQSKQDKIAARIAEYVDSPRLLQRMKLVE